MGLGWCGWHLGGVRYRANNNVLKFKSQYCSSRKIGPIQTKFYMCSWLDPWGTGNWPLGNCIHCWRCEPNFTTRVPGACNDNPDRPKQGCCTNRLFWRWLVALVARWWYIYDVLLYVLVIDCVQLSSFKSVEVKGSWGHHKQMPCGPDDLICQHVRKQKQVACAWIQTQSMKACVQ